MHPSHYDPSYASLHTSDDFTCIIDSPEITLDHPMFDFNITEQAEEILSAARSIGGKRKSMHALMSGRGTGKTRTVCEVRRELLQSHYHCLPLAITFNSNWSCFHFRKPSGDAGTRITLTALALEVVVRMASILYGVDCID